MNKYFIKDNGIRLPVSERKYLLNFLTPMSGKILFFNHFLRLIELDLIDLKDIKHTVFWFGRLAQLVEHLVYTEGVKGSSPLLPTKEWGCSSVG